MKLIITGASGLVATELIRQSLRMREITKVVALARKPVSAPADVSPADAAKLQSVVLDDYERYPDDVRAQLAGADACIWTVAVTPTKAQSYAFDELTRICHTCTLAGIRAMVEAGQARPFRFLYMSGQNGERDQSKKPILLPAYVKMRGETENQLLAFAAAQQPAGSVELCVAKPGIITGHHSSGLKSVMTGVLVGLGIVKKVDIQELVAAMLQQVRDGFEKEPLENDDLIRIGQKALASIAEGTK
ncbi:putative nucleoside-diphosphate-sugar epimerase [Schizothecium vesticola]|uniref:Nucleoside-diphosphate-sugar epimerase n=1 Tax=Schizothecium vesticola TaxID=314040 RepID=A0AA40F1S9_9PEZI|nr:putative nucleoside-diphosphate-sugar epimerase [Schizothecium vesticola]